jgi:hypothetical protein
MQTPETVLSPREVLNRMYERIKSAYSKVLSAQAGDVNADKQMIAEIEMIDLLAQKLSFSFLKKLRDDATVDANSFEKLKELENLLNDMITSKKKERYQNHYIYHCAKRWRNAVRGEANRTKNKGIKQLNKVNKEEKRLSQEKKEAQERAGVKKKAA